MTSCISVFRLLGYGNRTCLMLSLGRLDTLAHVEHASYSFVVYSTLTSEMEVGVDLPL